MRKASCAVKPHGDAMIRRFRIAASSHDGSCRTGYIAKPCPPVTVAS
ncbi:MAG: hypothetical protein IIZ15_02030 [Coriobacteriales bacterium]|nr:hypothetical protein [Coriobacteriales bacterium]